MRRDLELLDGVSLDGLAGSLGTLGELGSRLVATDTTAPVTPRVVLVKVVGLGSLDKVGELTLVLRSDLLDNSDGSGLLVDKSTERSLGSDDHVRDSHLPAKSREEDNKLNGVDISSDDNERSLLSLNKGNAVVQAVLDEEGLLAVSLGVGLLALGNVLGDSIETGLLLLLGLGAVLVKQLEEVGGGVLVKGVGELSNRRGNLQALVKDNLLPLEADVLGPLDEAGQVAGGLDVLAYNCES